VLFVHCPSCAFDDTKVIDSRMSEEGSAIRRRRNCSQCGYRFTTYERLEEQPLFVLKRGGSKQPFDRAKLMSGIQAAVKGRPVDDLAIMEMAERIEDKLRRQSICTHLQNACRQLRQSREVVPTQSVQLGCW